MVEGSNCKHFTIILHEILMPFSRDDCYSDIEEGATGAVREAFDADYRNESTDSQLR